MENVTIIGSGPAGLTCAIYLARANLKPWVIAGNTPGGQLVNTDMIENYPGFESISGSELMMKMIDQTEKLGANISYEFVEKISRIDNDLFEIKLSSNETIISKSVVIATGAKHRHLNIPGEKEFTNKGVSWCATCDGPIYKNKTVAVIGGGNTAVMEAMFLSNFVSQVYLIHRRDTLRADKFTQDKLFANKKIQCIWNSEVINISGNKSVEEITIKNNINNSEEKLKVDGIFIAIGTSPSSEFVKDFIDLDSEGYIITENTKTSQEGIFAVGDVVSGSLKQAIYAAGQGALAAKNVEEYLNIR